MNKALALTQQYFESSSGKTPQYLSWHRTFKRAFTQFLLNLGASKIEIRNPNHFDMSGFFTVNEQIWYFSISDLRFFKDSMLVRTAKDYRDFTGGTNQYVAMTQGEDFFKLKLSNIVK
jgi:hypothetical protein